MMCASVWMFLHTYYTTDNFKGATIAMERTLRGLPDGDNCDVPEHAGDLLISGKHISLVNIILVT